MSAARNTGLRVNKTLAQALEENSRFLCMCVLDREGHLHFLDIKVCVHSGTVHQEPL